ncbi:unnamed protein product [Pelagomonas calceolata]|uniref:Secreted protein n=1 Tax=Pelagomonas calceolata TaxID=35677 RepID=A0A8J2WQL2_9STRA|nr:unnamed protein product [Pelagomonas calceolata]
MLVLHALADLARLLVLALGAVRAVRVDVLGAPGLLDVLGVRPHVALQDVGKLHLADARLRPEDAQDERRLAGHVRLRLQGHHDQALLRDGRRVLADVERRVVLPTDRAQSGGRRRGRRVLLRLGEPRDRIIKGDAAVDLDA